MTHLESPLSLILPIISFQLYYVYRNTCPENIFTLSFLGTKKKTHFPVIMRGNSAMK